VNLDRPQRVTQESLRYKCAWSPLEGHEFGASVVMTIVNGTVVVDGGRTVADPGGRDLAFGF